MRTGLIAATLCACSFHAGDAPTQADATPPTVDVAPDAPPVHGPYPIVLAHGLFGFSSLGPLDYFYGISDALTASGRKVYAPRVDAVQSAEVRGAQLVMAIEAARLDSGADKVIVIGHSQGGLDARWAAAHDPDAIAAVVTVAAPHRGSPVADVALGLLPGDSTAALDILADFFGISTSGSTTSFAGALQSLSSAGAAQFNADTPDVPTIPYFSIAGRSNLAGNDACAPAAAPFMATWDGDRDPIGAELVPIVAILAAASLPATPTNDGRSSPSTRRRGDSSSAACQPITSTRSVRSPGNRQGSATTSTVSASGVVSSRRCDLRVSKKFLHARDRTPHRAQVRDGGFS